MEDAIKIFNIHSEESAWDWIAKANQKGWAVKSIVAIGTSSFIVHMSRPLTKAAKGQE
jgi:hypothetical protein